ncbi:hypothetical protein Tco_1396207 [Tanacetum coccineum]
MVGSLMYLTASHPNLVFDVCMCARYQAKPTKKHLSTVKWVFRYLKGTINMGFWYPKDTRFDLTAFVDADHAGYHLPRFKEEYFGKCTIFGRKEQVENEIVKLYFVKNNYQLVDIFTKALARERFEFLIHRLGMQRITPEELKSITESEEE